MDFFYITGIVVVCQTGYQKFTQLQVATVAYWLMNCSSTFLFINKVRIRMLVLEKGKKMVSLCLNKNIPVTSHKCFYFCHDATNEQNSF